MSASVKGRAAGVNPWLRRCRRFPGPWPWFAALSPAIADFFEKMLLLVSLFHGNSGKTSLLEKLL